MPKLIEGNPRAKFDIFFYPLTQEVVLVFKHLDLSCHLGFDIWVLRNGVWGKRIVRLILYTYYERGIDSKGEGA